MKRKIIVLYLSCVFLFGCTERKVYGEEAIITIHRFDKDLFEYLSGEKSQEDLLQDHRRFLDLYGENILGIGNSDSTGFFNRLTEYFSHPLLKQLYQDELKAFADISETEKLVSSGFQFLQSSFDSIQIPELYIHVSGLIQNIIISDKFLSVSADKYMGENYPLYTDFFYDYQRRNMVPERIAPDYLLGFLMAEYPIGSTGETLLDRMLYEGKLRYILSLALPSYSETGIIGYTDEQDEWCRKNESRIWKSILQEKHLYTQERLMIDKYIQDAPHTAFMPDSSPGRVGIWTGYRIILAYMKQAPQTSLQELIKNTDSQGILKISKYNP